MISYKNSRKILKNSKIRIYDEIIKSIDCKNRVLSENIFCKVNNPAGNNAAFDGYAINSKDTDKLNKNKTQLFKITGTIAAGNKPGKKKISKFETIEIMTGGLLPKGLDTIIPIEQVIFYPNKKNPNYILINKKIKKDEHVRFRGSDFKKGDLMIRRGTILEPNHILALKSLGVNTVKVKKKIKILFFSTGN